MITDEIQQSSTKTKITDSDHVVSLKEHMQVRLLLKFKFKNENTHIQSNLLVFKLD